MAGALVEHMRVGDQIMSKHGAPAASRILTDDMTGRSDRVVLEWEVEGPSASNTEFYQVMAKTEVQEEMGLWMEKLATLIDHTEGETRVVQ
jgi:hypothetical protein